MAAAIRNTATPPADRAVVVHRLVADGPLPVGPGTNQILADENVLGNATGVAGSVLWGLTDNQYTVSRHHDVEPQRRIIHDHDARPHRIHALRHPVSRRRNHRFPVRVPREMYGQDVGLQFNGGFHPYSPKFEALAK